MIYGTRVKHRKSGATGTCRGNALGNVHVIWDNQLNCPPPWVNLFDLEVING